MFSSDRTGLITGVETLTPEAAFAALEKMNGNRTLQRKKVNEYASAMERGQWTLSQPILFDSAGKLIDGQHRLHALIKSQTTQQFLVVRGLDPIVKAHIDIGKPRTVTDILKMSNIKNVAQVATITRCIVGMERGAKSPGALHIVSPPPTVDDIVERGLSDAVIQHVAQAMPRKFRAMVKSTQLAGWFLYCGEVGMDYNIDIFYNFVDIVIGDSCAKHSEDPAHMLANRLNRVEHSTNKTSAITRIALTVKAWNAFYRGETIANLRYRPVGSNAEEFPSMALDLPVPAAGTK